MSANIKTIFKNTYQMIIPFQILEPNMFYYTHLLNLIYFPFLFNTVDFPSNLFDQRIIF